MKKQGVGNISIGGVKNVIIFVRKRRQCYNGRLWKSQMWSDVRYLHRKERTTSGNASLDKLVVPPFTFIQTSFREQSRGSKPVSKMCTLIISFFDLGIISFNYVLGRYL